MLSSKGFMILDFDPLFNVHYFYNSLNVHAKWIMGLTRTLPNTRHVAYLLQWMNQC